MSLKYYFKPVNTCNMCGAEAQTFKQLGFRLNQSQGFNPKSKSGVSVSIKKCSNCNLIFSDPQPLPESVSEQYDVEPEDYWQETELSWDENYFKEEIRILKTLQPSSTTKLKALDVGAGYGRCMRSLERAGYDSYGFEPSKPFYNLAISKFDIPKERIRFSTIENAEYSENSFDFISFGAVLEHLHDPNSSLKKAMKWLKPEGIIHIEVPSSGWFIPKLFNFYYQKVKRTNYVTHLSPMHLPFHHYEFDEKSFIENGKINDFSVAFSKVEVCSTMMPTKIFDGLLKKYMKWTNTGMELIIFLRKHE